MDFIISYRNFLAMPQSNIQREFTGLLNNHFRTRIYTILHFFETLLVSLLQRREETSILGILCINSKGTNQEKSKVMGVNICCRVNKSPFPKAEFGKTYTYRFI